MVIFPGEPGSGAPPSCHAPPYVLQEKPGISGMGFFTGQLSFLPPSISIKARKEPRSTTGNPAYGPANAATTSSSLASLKSRLVYLSGAGLPRLSRKKRPQNGCLVCLVVVVVPRETWLRICLICQTVAVSWCTDCSV